MILSMKCHKATHTQLSLYINFMAETFHNSRIINNYTRISPLYPSRIGRNVLVSFSLSYVTFNVIRIPFLWIFDDVIKGMAKRFSFADKKNEKTLFLIHYIALVQQHNQNIECVESLCGLCQSKSVKCQPAMRDNGFCWKSLCNRLTRRCRCLLQITKQIYYIRRSAEKRRRW